MEALAPIHFQHLSNNEVSDDVAWNVRDPFQFDHPTDHIPGIVLIESAVYGSQKLFGTPNLEGFTLDCYVLGHR